MKKKLRQYNVSFDMKYSWDFVVKARGKAEAKAKGFEKFKRKRNQRSSYNIDVDRWE